MYFLQTDFTPNLTPTLLVGTFGMLLLSVSLVLFIALYQRKVNRANERLKKNEEEKQQILLEASIRFQEEERNKLAADLHDDAGPLLATARLYLTENLVNQQKPEQLEAIRTVKKLIDDTLFLVRNISHGLMPPMLINFGLESALTNLFQKINGTGNIVVSCRFHNPDTSLNAEQELLVFRIIQELTNNILKHSSANYIHLTQNTNGGNMYFRVHHNGVGIVQKNFEKLAHTAAGLGLKNVTSRVKMLRGKIFFEIDESKTYYKITLEIPL